MHWTAIAARQLQADNSEIIGIRVNSLSSFGCLLISILGVYVGLTIASFDKFFASSPEQRYTILDKSKKLGTRPCNPSFSYSTFLSNLGWIFSGGIIAGKN